MRWGIDQAGLGKGEEEGRDKDVGIFGGGGGNGGEIRARLWRVFVEMLRGRRSMEGIMIVRLRNLRGWYVEREE